MFSRIFVRLLRCCPDSPDILCLCCSKTQPTSAILWKRHGTSSPELPIEVVVVFKYCVGAAVLTGSADIVFYELICLFRAAIVCDRFGEKKVKTVQKCMIGCQLGAVRR